MPRRERESDVEMPSSLGKGKKRFRDVQKDVYTYIYIHLYIYLYIYMLFWAFPPIRLGPGSALLETLRGTVVLEQLVLAKTCKPT